MVRLIDIMLYLHDF